ncbi:MAG: hypothetical protein AAGI23_08275 [Bacteroidota bacterium]
MAPNFFEKHLISQIDDPDEVSRFLAAIEEGSWGIFEMDEERKEVSLSLEDESDLTLHAFAERVHPVYYTLSKPDLKATYHFCEQTAVFI